MTETMPYISAAFSFLATFAVSVLGFYFKGVDSRQQNIETHQNILEESIRSMEKEFVSHEEFNKNVDRMEQNLSSIHQRLDKLIETVNNNQQQTLIILNNLVSKKLN